MELRVAEQDVAEMRVLYGGLRKNSGELEKHLPPLLDEADDAATVIDETKNKSATELLQLLESLRERLLGLRGKMDRFRKRQSEKDPVTEKPRYGEKTLARVIILLERYEDLQKAIDIAFGEVEETDNGSVVIQQLQHQAGIEAEEKASILREEHETREREEAAKKAEEERIAEEKRRAEEAERLEIERQREERARAIEAARLAEARAQQEAERADREWIDSLTKGPDGIKMYLKELVESTKDDPASQTTAINALHTLFSQIVSRPEETSFRRIRRDHPRFNQDIGRLPGGKEILIAAGFTLGAIDDVPSYLSIEPNIEKDMDGWAAWFDLLKKTLEIIEEQMINM